MVVLLRQQTRAAHDGCLAHEEVLSVGDVRSERSDHTDVRWAFALADDAVARVELRAEGEVLVDARLVELDRQVDGRRRLFLLPDGEGLWASGRDLEVVALDEDGEVLRRVGTDREGAFGLRGRSPNSHSMVMTSP